MKRGYVEKKKVLENRLAMFITNNLIAFLKRLLKL